MTGRHMVIKTLNDLFMNQQIAYNISRYKIQDMSQRRNYADQGQSLEVRE